MSEKRPPRLDRTERAKRNTDPHFGMSDELAWFQGFVNEMKKKGIHMGVGSNPRCVTCGNPWPCPTEESNQ